MTHRGEVLIRGAAEGPVLRFDAPISFWGGVEPSTSKVVMAGHPQRGEEIAGKVLVIPDMIGSSSSSAVLLELLWRDIAPLALILGARDAILPVGVVVARQMGWRTIPVVVLDEPPFRTGQTVGIAEDGRLSVS